MISVCGGVTLFAECLGAATVVIKSILFTANLIVSGSLAEYYTFHGVFWMAVMFLKSGVLVLGFFSIYKFVFRLAFSRWTWCLGII